eukprot:g45476.t1
MLSKTCFGEGIHNWVRLLYTNIISAVSIDGIFSICKQFELVSGAKVRGHDLWELGQRILSHLHRQDRLPEGARDRVQKGQGMHKILGGAYCQGEKFAQKSIFDHPSIRKWLVRNILETLWKKKWMDPVAWFPEQTVKFIWQNASSLELSSKYQDIAWLVNKELTLTKCCRLAHSKVQDYVLRDALKL